MHGPLHTQHHLGAWLWRSLTAVVMIGALTAISASPAHAWDARSIEGTEAERRNTTTPLPPGGDQCSLGAPDEVPRFYDFSWGCYAHDVCYQNHQLNGAGRSRLDCDNIMLAKLDAECRDRHSRWSPTRYACYEVADTYWEAVRLLGLPSWNSWNGLPE